MKRFKINDFFVAMLCLVATVGCTQIPTGSHTFRDPEEKPSVSPDLEPIQKTSLCEDFIPASAMTLASVWKFKWNEDGNEVTSFSNNEHTYNKINAVSIENTAWKILASNRDLARNDIDSLSESQYFQIIYFSQTTENQFQIALHRAIPVEFSKMKSAFEESMALSAIPTTQAEACYTLVTEKIQRPLVSTTQTNEGGFLSHIDEIGELFENRQPYITTAYEISRPSQESTDVSRQVGLNITLMDTDNKLEPIHISFKQSQEDFNDLNAIDVKPTITGLTVSNLFIGSTNYDTRVFGQHLKDKRLNPFERIFLGFSLTENDSSNPVEFTVTISQLSMTGSLRPTNESDTQPVDESASSPEANINMPFVGPPDPIDLLPEETQSPSLDDETGKIPSDVPANSEGSPSGEETETEESLEGTPSESSEETESTSSDQALNLSGSSLEDAPLQREESVMTQDELTELFCHGHYQPDQFVTVSERTPNIVWQAKWNEDKTQVIALSDRLGKTYSLVNSVSIENEGFQILASDKDLAIAYLERNQAYFEVLYMPDLSDSQNLTIQLHRVTRLVFEQIQEAHKNELPLTQVPMTQLEACYVIATQRDLSIHVGRIASNPNRSNLNKNLEDFLKNRQANLTASAGLWRDSGHISGFHRQVGINLKLEDTNNNLEPVNIVFKQSRTDFDNGNAVDDVEPLITGLSVPTNYLGWFAAPYTNYDDRIVRPHLKSKSFNPLQFIFGFSGPISEYDQAKADFTITISAPQQNSLEVEP